MIKAQYALICEVFREGLNKKADVLGIFDRTWVEQLPAAHQNMFFIVQLYAENEDDLGTKSFTMRIYRPAGGQLGEFSGQFTIKPDAGTYLASGRVVFQLSGMPLPDAGRYRFVLEVDGREVASHPYSVAIGKPPKA